MISVDEAMARSGLAWDPNVGHVDAETAYLDRTVLASEVRRLRQDLVATEEALHEAEQEVRDILDTHPTLREQP